MTEVRVGDVYINTFRSNPEPFVVTALKKNVMGISRKGTLVCVYWGNLVPEKYKLLAHYDTWQEAIASKEFNNAG